MTTTTYNTRTLAACAKRLRFLERSHKPFDMPAWAIIWRYEEGFRLQVAGEQHERDGWITYGPLTSSTAGKIERDLQMGRADEIAEESLALLLQVQPEDFSDDQLRKLCTCDDDRLAAKATVAAYARWHLRHLGRKIA